MPHTRPSGRSAEQIRAVSLDIRMSRNMPKALALSNLVTRMSCARPLWKPACRPGCAVKGRGWVTAEYGMLPRATGERMRREANVG